MKRNWTKRAGKRVHDLQLVDNFFQVVGLNLTGHDFHHLLADLADLLVLGIGGFSDLVVAPLCETHAEQTQKVAISGLHIHMSFDHGLTTKEIISPITPQTVDIVYKFREQFPLVFTAHVFLGSKNHQLCEINAWWSLIREKYWAKMFNNQTDLPPVNTLCLLDTLTFKKK